MGCGNTKGIPRFPPGWDFSFFYCDETDDGNKKLQLPFLSTPCIRQEMAGKAPIRLFVDDSSGETPEDNHPHSAIDVVTPLE